MIPVTLYTKPDCSLCDRAKVMLARFEGEYDFSLDEVDITRDPVLQATYGARIPVLQIGRREVAAPITLRQIAQALRMASQDA